MTDIPQKLLERLDRLGSVLAVRGDALGLIGLGSVGVDLARLDEHSDLDFFVVVDKGAKLRYLEAIDWLEALAPVAFSFANTADGRKVLFADGVYAEYAIFTLPELCESTFSPGRMVWQRHDAPDGLERYGHRSEVPLPTATHQVNEALTNLYVGLHREARGERLAATRLIQVHAIDRIMTFLDLTVAAERPPQDEFARERGAESRFAEDVLPLAAMVPGYDANPQAALAILDWLEARVEIDQSLATAIQALARDLLRA
jgi:hypothetical protein